MKIPTFVLELHFLTYIIAPKSHYEKVYVVNSTDIDVNGI